jgi:probable HAF family extracellular repeat protein
MRRLLLLLVASVVALTASAAGTAGSGQARWVIRDLGTVGGLPISGAVAINDRGQVAANAGVSASAEYGVAYGSGGVTSRAFLWQKGKITDLGTLGGVSSYCSAINARGQVVGWADTKAKNADGSPITHAFLWEKGHMTDLGTLGGKQSRAVAINERSQVVGWGDVGGDEHAFLWEKGHIRDLGVLPGRHWSWVIPAAINVRGVIVGLAGTAASPDGTAFLWDNGHLSALSTPQGWPAWGGASPGSVAINDRGEIVGTVNSGSTPWSPALHAVLWRAGRPIDLGAGTARAINERGQVVFASKLWQQGKTLDLRMDATGINARGLVIGARGKSYRERGDFQSSYCWLAAVWQGGRITDLGAIGTSQPCDVSHQNSRPMAVNSTGMVVGYSGTTRAQHAVLWTPRRGT